MELIHNNSSWECNLIAACQSYFDIINEMQLFDGLSLYGKDNLRIQEHERLVECSGLSKEEMYSMTNNMQNFESGADFYIAIIDLIDSKKRNKGVS